MKRTKTQRRIGGKANQDQLKAPDVTSRDWEGGGTGRNGELTQGLESSAQLEELRLLKKRHIQSVLSFESLKFKVQKPLEQGGGMSSARRALLAALLASAVFVAAGNVPANLQGVKIRSAGEELVGRYYTPSLRSREVPQ